MASQRSVDDLLAVVRRSGLRVTAARRAVLHELVAAGDQHLTADDLAARIAARSTENTAPRTHLSTVYRTLESLTESGVLVQARFADKPVTYHLADDVHHHAVCERCGATAHVGDDALDPLRRHLADELGFTATPRHLTISGICRTCRDATRAR